MINNAPVIYRVGDEAAALQWMATNASVMLQHHKAIMKRHGVWVATETYTSRQCAVAVINDESTAVVIGFRACTF